MIDRDIRSLYRTGLFEFYEVKREVLADRKVNLVRRGHTEITGFSAVRFEGNKKVQEPPLEKEIQDKSNTALDDRQVKRTRKPQRNIKKPDYNQASDQLLPVEHREHVLGLRVTITFKISRRERK